MRTETHQAQNDWVQEQPLGQRLTAPEDYNGFMLNIGEGRARLNLPEIRALDVIEVQYIYPLSS